MNAEEVQRLDDWAKQLSGELGIDSDEFRAALDIDGILGLAGVAAHAILRPAAPVTTFLVGYAAGLAAASGADPGTAIRTAEVTAHAAAAAAGTASLGANEEKAKE